MRSVLDCCCASDDVVINSDDVYGDDSVRRCHGVVHIDGETGQTVVQVIIGVHELTAYTLKASESPARSGTRVDSVLYVC